MSFTAQAEKTVCIPALIHNQAFVISVDWYGPPLISRGRMQSVTVFKNSYKTDIRAPVLQIEKYSLTVSPCEHKI